MSRWGPGSTTIDDMLADGRLERVPASREQADFMIAEARKHAAAADAIAGIDATGAYQLMYDGARKALAAMLEVQGLRATSAGGHVAVIDAVEAQLGAIATKVLRPFNRMRRTRHSAEYPSASAPTVMEDDVRDDLPRALSMIDMSAQALDALGEF